MWKTVGNVALLIISVLIILLALSVILNKSAIASAFSLIGLMVLLAAIYAMIGVHFVAAIQLIVYAGAIMVLFVFSIMLLNYNEIKSEIDFKSNFVYISILSAFILSLALAMLFKTPFTPLMGVENGVFTDELVKKEGGNIMALSKLLFSKYFMHFEIISLLLLVALIGALTVAKRKVD